MLKELFHHPKRPPLTHGYSAAGAKLLAAETANAVTVPYLQPFPHHTDRALRAVALTNTAL